MPLKAVFPLTCFAALWLAASGFTAKAQTNPAPTLLSLAQNAYKEAETQFHLKTNDVAAASHFARACFEYADLATNETQRAELAKVGIAVSRQMVAGDAKSGAGHYLLAMNLGELAQAEAPSLAAYKLVHEVEREFKLAADLDVKLDCAGPARTLGLLYFQAPGWPFSIGNKRKAQEWLEKAVALSPEFPENQLNLAEAYLKWRSKDEAAKTLANLETIWPAAKTNFTGTAHARDWHDWEERRRQLRGEFQRLYKTAP
jgi:tetratricopeptide (TPR) repeat protein